MGTEDEVLRLLSAHRGSTTRTLRWLVGANGQTVRSVLLNLERAGRVVGVRQGRKIRWYPL